MYFKDEENFGKIVGKFLTVVKLRHTDTFPDHN